jgi:hypothetical protein
MAPGPPPPSPDPDLTALNTELAAPTRQAAPRSGVGIETAGQLLVTAGDNPDLQQATTSR